MQKPLTIIISALAIGLLAGCGGGSDLSSSPDAAKIKPAGELSHQRKRPRRRKKFTDTKAAKAHLATEKELGTETVVPPEAPPVLYAYNPIGRRDPFAPLRNLYPKEPEKKSADEENSDSIFSNDLVGIGIDLAPEGDDEGLPLPPPDFPDMTLSAVIYDAENSICMFQDDSNIYASGDTIDPDIQLSVAKIEANSVILKIDFGNNEYTRKLEIPLIEGEEKDQTDENY